MKNIKLLLLFIAFYNLPFSANANIREIQPNEVVELRQDEGLLVVSFDTSLSIDRAGIKPLGKIFGNFSLNKPKSGITTKLLLVTAGKYTWGDISLYSVYFPLRRDIDFTFDVIPGVINYPGNLIFRPEGFMRAKIHIANRSLAHMDWLREKFPQINAKYAFAYSGKYPDPFPAFYAKELKGFTGPIVSKVSPIPSIPKLPLATEVLWRTKRIDSISISPGGQYISEVINTGEKEKSILLIDINTAQVTKYFSCIDVMDLTWINNDSFIISYKKKTDYAFIVNSYTYAIKIIDNDAGKLKFKAIQIPRNGNVLDPMPNNPNYFLFASWSSSGGDGVLVHKVSKLNLEELGHSSTYTAKSRSNIGLENDSFWLTNRHGEIIAAISHKDDKSLLLLKNGNAYQTVRELPADDVFQPVAISDDGKNLFVLSDEGRTQRDLVLFNINDNKVTDTIFSRYGVDIDSVIYDANRQPVGVNYYLDGQLQNEYFNTILQNINKRLSQSFPNSNLRLLDKSSDGSRALIYVDSSVNPGAIYLFDTIKNTAENIDDDSPWLSTYQFSESQTIKVKTSDNLQIEGYLTLPKSSQSKNAPLIVMPHGGPIGVRDDRHFNRDVQFLASLGYAVLQINFRGSEGYGKTFTLAGKGSFGSAIENDVDAVTSAALAQYPLDKNKMCIIGSSYGGYSALVSIMRWPDRFKCAISFSGISDRILSFSASDSVRSQTSRAWMEQYFGNPLVQLDKMVSEQPLYGYKKIVTPLMLIHGTEDIRVDYENALRLQRMLTFAEKPPVMLTLKNEGHGYTNLTSISISWQYIAAFLNMHLGQNFASISPPPTAKEVNKEINLAH